MFKLISKFEPTGDQPEAIKKLLEGLKSGKKHQVLLVTHLPQIASFADRHIKVSKYVEGKRTKTHYAAVEGEARVRELAEMMAGEKKSEVATKHARELLAQTK